MEKDSLDQLIEQLLRYSIRINGELMMEQAAAALVQLRDSEALARGKIAEQMIEIARLKMNQRCSAIEQGEVGYPCVFRAEAEAEVARLKQWQVDMVAKAADKSLDGYRELGAKCAALEAERDALKALVEQLRGLYQVTHKQMIEIARLTKLETECWSNPEAWMKWCDVRVLERAERSEQRIKELEAQIGNRS